MIAGRPLTRFAGARARSGARAGAGAKVRRGSVISGLLVLVLAVSGLVYAFGGDDYPVSDVTLNDAGVWVSSLQVSTVARLNTEANSLEAPVRMTTDDPGFDILQRDATVILFDPAAKTLQPVDPVQGTTGTAVATPSNALASMNGGTVAVLASRTGQLWSAPADRLSSLDVKNPSILTAGPGAAAAVGSDGTTFVVDPTHGRLLSLAPGAATATSTIIEGLAGATGVSLTTVGTTPVILATGSATGSTTAQLWLGPRVHRTVQNLGARPVLQQPGPDQVDADDVLLATDTQLLSVPLGSATAAVTNLITAGKSGGGAAAAPVRLGDCAFGLWSAAATHVRSCDGVPAGPQPVTGVSAGDQLKFRVNRGRVVINDLLTGAGLLPDDQPIHVTDWSALDQQAKQQQRKQDHQDDTTEEIKRRDPHQKNLPPVAKDDHYGARAGAGVIVRALENDTDPNGDVLAIDGISGLSAQDARAAVIENGQAIQVVAKAAGTFSFGYTISDPYGKTSDATITIDVRPSTEEEAPAVRSGARRTASVQSGKKVRYDVLADWVDPDGDPLTLKNVLPPLGGQVHYTAAGMLTYLDGGAVSGAQDIDVTVSDGVKSSQATVSVDVQKGKPAPPIARDDVVTGVVGQPLTVSPLDNDTDPNDDPLTLSRAPSAAGLQIDTDRSQTSLGITAKAAGTYPLTYQVSDGARASTGNLRVTITEPKNQPPTAVDDALFVPASGYGEVDLLANDVDPDGDVLVVQDVARPAPPNADAVKVALLDHRLLRVWTNADISTPIRLGYTISDGTHSGPGSVLIRSGEAAGTNQPPTAVDDDVTVRAGDVVTVPVLDNDSDPDGDRLTLDPHLTQTGVPGGVLFSGGSTAGTVRFQAPERPGTVTAVYSAVDPSGEKTSAQILFTIRRDDADPDRDQPPAPVEVLGRVLAGATVRIPVPLNGIDPDGDSTVLQGAASSPRLGQVTGVEDGDTLVYQAFEDSKGTDSFSYRVSDSHGVSATATVRIGVAPRSIANQDPTAVDDTVSIRPGRTVAVPVLDNDTDPDGDLLTLPPAQQLIVAGPGRARIVNGRIEVSSNGTPGRIALQYAIDDGRGGHDTAYLQVTVSATAPLLAPLAHDDVVQAGADPQAEVNVLANDDDPDGRPSDLKVTLTGPAAAHGSVTAGGKVTIRREQYALAVAYQVTDADQLTSTAFIRVPGIENQPPRLRSGVRPLEVKAGQSATIKLADWVLDPEGSPLALAGPPDLQFARGTARADGRSAITLTPSRSFAGSTSVSFTVTDSPRSGLPLTAAIQVPIRVTSQRPGTPRFQNTQLTLRRDGKPVRVDLRSFVLDPGAPSSQQYQFSVGRVPDTSISANISSGSVLQVQAAAKAGAPAQQKVTLPVAVRGRDGRSSTGTMTLLVETVTRPLPVAHDLQLTSPVGRPVTIAWRDAVTAAPGSTLTLQRAATVSPPTAGRTAVTGPSVTLTPAPVWSGPATVYFAVTDTPGDARRSVPVRAVVSFQALPGTPGAPVLVRQAAGTATLSWVPALANGSPIQRYRLSDGAGLNQDCAGTTCTVTGLSSGHTYRFTVSAVNAVGTGRPSPASAPITADDRPDVPAAPVATFVPGGVGQRIDVSWEPVPGKAIGYEVRASPGGASFTTSRTTQSFTGLTNGTAYTFAVRARSGTGPFTAFGGQSQPETPAGVPGAPSAPTVVQESGSQVRVSWDAPATNGAPITQSTVRITGGVSRSVSVGAGASAVEVSLDTGKDYQFQVQATNKSGTSPFGPATAKTLVSAPDRITNLSAEPKDGAAHLTFSAPVGGVAPTGYEYSQNGGAFKALAESRIVDGLDNGTSYSFRVHACTSEACGDASAASAPVTPFGDPGKPLDVKVSAAASSMDKPVFSWCPPKSNGRAIDHMEYRINGSGDWTSTSAGCGSVTSTMTEYARRSVEVRAVDSTGASGPSDLAMYVLNQPSMDATFVSAGDFGVGCTGTGCELQTWDIHFHGDYPRGVQNVDLREGMAGGCGGGHLATVPAAASGPFSDQTFRVTAQKDAAPYMCGFTATNSWTGAIITWVTAR